MTKDEYIRACPRSHLAKALKREIEGNPEIILGDGVITNNHLSNLQKTLKEHNSDRYVVGGTVSNRANAKYWAVIVGGKTA